MAEETVGLEGSVSLFLPSLPYLSVECAQNYRNSPLSLSTALSSCTARHSFDSFQNISKELIPVAIEKYLGGTDDPVQKKDLFLDLIGDVFFCFPSVTVARYHRGEFQRFGGRRMLTHYPSVSIDRCVNW